MSSEIIWKYEKPNYEILLEKIDKLQKENEELKEENKNLKEFLNNEILGRDMIVSLNSNLQKENKELKEKIKEYEIGIVKE